MRHSGNQSDRAVPDDEHIVISTNQGEPLVGSNCLAGQAYENICHRILGEEVAFLDLDAKQGEWESYQKTVSQWEIDEYLYKI